jgi:hypothetical protein
MRILECPLPPAKRASGTLFHQLHPSQFRHVKTDLQHILYVACVLKPTESLYCEYPFSCDWSCPPSSASAGPPDLAVLSRALLRRGSRIQKGHPSSAPQNSRSWTTWTLTLTRAGLVRTDDGEKWHHLSYLQTCFSATIAVFLVNWFIHVNHVEPEFFGGGGSVSLICMPCRLETLYE